MSTRTSGAVAIAFMLCATPAFAQASQYPAPGDGLGAANGRTRTPSFYSPRSGPRTLTARELDGPPAPDAMRALVSLDPVQLEAYSKAYDGLMRDTRTERDSARSVVQTSQQADAAGDREAVQASETVLGRLGDHIAKRDAAFERSLKTLLTGEQWQRYDRWKQELRKEAAKAR